MASAELVKLRYDSTSFESATEKLKTVHARPNDAKRSEQEYNRRKKEHEDSLLVALNTTQQSQEEIYRLFCEELDDCYDTDMLSLICQKFQCYIQSHNQIHKRYAEYLFAKIASWSTNEPRMCAYVTELLNASSESNNSTDETITSYNHSNAGPDHNNALLTPLNTPRNAGISRGAAISNGTSALKTALKSKKEFFDQLNKEINHADDLKNTPVTTKQINHADDRKNTPVTTNEQVTEFLSRIQRSAGRTYVSEHHSDFYAQNTTLVKTAENIENAIKAIHLFSWDHNTREQKFIKKVVEALQKNSDNQISIHCGIGLSRKEFRFTRTELLISIRANPSLYAEFNKALREDEVQRTSAIFSFGKTAREKILLQEASVCQMFEASDNDFATQAIILLSSLEPTKTINNERPTDIVRDLTERDLESEERESRINATQPEHPVISHSTLSGRFGLLRVRERQNTILQQPFQPSGYSLLQILVNAARIFSPLTFAVLPSLVIPRFNTRSSENSASNAQTFSAPLLITSGQDSAQNGVEGIQKTSQEVNIFQQNQHIEEDRDDRSESDEEIFPSAELDYQSESSSSKENIDPNSISDDKQQSFLPNDNLTEKKLSGLPQLSLEEKVARSFFTHENSQLSNHSDSGDEIYSVGGLNEDSYPSYSESETDEIYEAEDLDEGGIRLQLN